MAIDAAAGWAMRRKLAALTLIHVSSIGWSA
jgi:hypothetical protein